MWALCFHLRTKRPFRNPPQRCGRVHGEPSDGLEPPSAVIKLAPAVGNRCSSAAPAAAMGPRHQAILGKLVKTTVPLQADAAMLRRRSRKHRPNPGSRALQAFVIWSQPRRQVAAVVGFSRFIQVIIHWARERQRRQQRGWLGLYFWSCLFLSLYYIWK